MTRSARSVRRAALLALAPALLACAASGCTDAGKHEAASLVGAVDAYQRAQPGPSKADRGKAVADVPCSDARVCEAKRVCVSAIELTVRAIALRDDVAARVADLETGALSKDAIEARQLPTRLDEAERLLTEGRARMAECDSKLRDLQLDFGV